MNWEFLLAVIMAEVVGTVAGFGSSTILLPVALLFFDFGNALVLVAFVHIVGNLAKVEWFRKRIDKKLLLVFGLPSVVASIVGASLVPLIQQDTLKVILGLFLIVCSGIGFIEKGIRVRGNGEVLVVGGILSGFL